MGWCETGSALFGENEMIAALSQFAKNDREREEERELYYSYYNYKLGIGGV